MARIYLDHNASTPIDPVVAAAMRPFLETDYGNPSSGHWAAAPAKAALDNARRQVAALLGCATDEIIFTSGGSEANNLALKGLCRMPCGRAAHIITSQIEHPATLEPCRFLSRLGAAVTYVPVDGNGLVDPDDIRKAVTRDTRLISVMHANNEVGTIQPIADIATIAREHGILLHSDAAQSVGKISTRVDELGVDLLSVAGHKLYAPKGIGALYVRRGVALEPLIHGAGHEGGRRAGTESALLAVGLGQACEVAQPWIGTQGVQQAMIWTAVFAPSTCRLSGVSVPRYSQPCRCGCLDRVSLSCRPGHAVTRAAGDEGRATRRHGSDPVQPWALHDST